MTSEPEHRHSVEGSRVIVSKIPVKDYYEEYTTWNGKTLKISLLVLLIQECLKIHDEHIFDLLP